LENPSRIQKQLKVLISIIGSTLFLLILFAILASLQITAIVNHYQSTMQGVGELSYELYLALETYDDCPTAQQLEDWRDKLESFPTALPRINLVLLKGALLLMGLVFIISSITVLLIAKIWYKRQSDTHKRELTKARERGRVETLRSIARELVADKDVLSELTHWLRNYRQGKSEADIDAAARIHSRVLERLVRQIRLRPIKQTGDVVQFDPEFYTTYASLKIGEKVIVREPGWRVGNYTIKKPVVGEYQ
jgi:hypothetical protein